MPNNIQAAQVKKALADNIQAAQVKKALADNIPSAEYFSNVSPAADHEILTNTRPRRHQVPQPRSPADFIGRPPQNSAFYRSGSSGPERAKQFEGPRNRAFIRLRPRFVPAFVARLTG